MLKHDLLFVSILFDAQMHKYQFTVTYKDKDHINMAII